jgi:segregation and condensation protein B
LDYFNLKTLDELPPLAEIRDLDEINRSLDLNDTDKASDDNVPSTESADEAIAADSDDGEEHVTIDEQLAGDDERIEDIDALYEVLGEVNTDFNMDPKADDEDDVVDQDAATTADDESVVENDGAKEPVDPQNG